MTTQLKTSGILVMLTCCSKLLFAQQTPPTDSTYRTVVAGSQYATDEAHQRRWGKHYRAEWNTAVKVKVAKLDTLAGGLTPYEAGGGRQSKTLRLRNANGREYVLRSIDKSFGKALPEIAHGTFIEAIANDQVSIGHPYAAVTIPPMIEAAGIYHTNPQILYIPKQSRLGEFNDEYGDMLYLFEQRPDENWEDASNFGNSKKIIGTEKLREKLMDDNKNRIDQLAFVRARLFDMFIGDWGRHEDQWRWAAIEDGNQTWYRAIPRDRDQAYTLFDGNMITLLFRVGGLDHLQSFEHTIKDVTTYNFPARNLDRFAANEVSRDQWLKIARELQFSLSNEVIEQAIRQLPPEVYPISGPTIIEKLKSRRDHLAEYANAYYGFIAKNVDVPVSDKSELFDIVRSGDSTTVNIYRLDKNGLASGSPIYSRTFHASETEEIRLYGMSGDDKFTISGTGKNSSLIRIIPGAGADILSDKSSVAGGRKTVHVYDDKTSGLKAGNESRIHISDNTAENNYQYTHFKNDDRGFVFKPGLTIGVGYKIQTQRWRKEPFGYEHKWMLLYGPNRGAMAFEYTFTANQLIGKWNLATLARLDIPLVANFYGIGNESVMNTEVNRRFYRYRSTGFTTGVQLNRLIDSMHYLAFGVNLQSINVKNDLDRFIRKDASVLPASVYERQMFVQGGGEYQFTKMDHLVVPTRGMKFNIGASYTRNVSESDRSFASYGSSVSAYLPVLKKLILAVRAGGEAITGKPEFYQLATLSGKDNLRGYRRQRFYGKTSFYNNNELRLMLDTRNRWFNGKYGILAFVDQGRVWQPGEKSDKWHVGYGGGIFVAPFNRILLNATYGISEEDQVVHLRLGFLF